MSAPSPAEASEIGSAESHFSFTFDHEQSFGELGLQCFDNSGSAIGRTIVDDQYVEWFAKLEYIANDIFNIFLFVVRWNDDKTTSRLVL